MPRHHAPRAPALQATDGAELLVYVLRRRPAARAPRAVHDAHPRAARAGPPPGAGVAQAPRDRRRAARRAERRRRILTPRALAAQRRPPATVAGSAQTLALAARALGRRYTPPTPVEVCPRAPLATTPEARGAPHLVARRGLPRRRVPQSAPRLGARLGVVAHVRSSVATQRLGADAAETPRLAGRLALLEVAPAPVRVARAVPRPDRRAFRAAEHAPVAVRPGRQERSTRSARAPPALLRRQDAGQRDLVPAVGHLAPPHPRRDGALADAQEPRDPHVRPPTRQEPLVKPRDPRDRVRATHSAAPPTRPRRSGAPRPTPAPGARGPRSLRRAPASTPPPPRRGR